MSEINDLGSYKLPKQNTVDTNKLTMRGSYAIAVGNAVTDHVLLGIALDFDNQVMRKMQSLSPADLAARLHDDSKVLVATKVDGEGTYVYFDAAADAQFPAFAFSAGGRVRVGFPALTELTVKLRVAGVQKALIRCELCLHNTAADGARAGVAEVIRISFSGSDVELATLKLVLLDLVMLDGKDLRANQNDFAQTLALMQKLVGTDENSRVHCMASEIVLEKEVAAVFARRIEAGHEGIVVRRLNRAEAWKIKPHRTVDAVIIGFVEGELEAQYGVTSLLTALSYPSADSEDKNATTMQTFARVGSGLSDADRVSLLDRLRALKVSEPIAMTDSSGRAVHFVRPELIAEIHGEDLIFSDSGKSLQTQVVRWNAASGRYEFLGLAPCPRLSFARFAKLREDKNLRDGGARISQISKAPTPNAKQTVAFEPAKILRREVYLKGETLRKLVVVHQAAAGEFPYLIYWTDFSAKRAEPLKVSVEIAANPERAHLLAERMLVDNLAKGWVRHG
jgi:hypothetical protein